MKMLSKLITGILIAGVSAVISYSAVAADSVAVPVDKADAKKDEAKPSKQEAVKKVIAPASGVAAPVAK